jgi:pimeloyl-ACP methyl ester carboxylesterase
MAFHRRGDVVIRYEQHGAGFPLLLLPPGGMNATIAVWERSAFNPIEIFKSSYRVVAVDQRNSGGSSGPLDMDDPWGSYATDHLELMNHLGVERFHVLGCCIGCSYSLYLAKVAPHRVASAVLEDPIGIDEINVERQKSGPRGSERVMPLPNAWVEWSAELLAKRPELDRDTLEAWGRKMWATDFVLSVTREFVRSSTTPLLVLPGTPGDLPHPTAIGRELAALAPNAEIIEPWKQPADRLPSTVRSIASFLAKHTPDPLSC